MLLVTELFHFDPDITGISCSGRFTLGTRLSETEAMMQTMLDEGVRKLVLDLTHVDFVDSAGLGVIMRISGELNERGGHFRICRANERYAALRASHAHLRSASRILTWITSVQKLAAGEGGTGRSLIFQLCSRAGKLAESFDAVFQAPFFQRIDQRLAGAGIPEVHRPDFDRARAGQHELDHIFGGADAADADDWESSLSSPPPTPCARQ